MAPRLYVIAQDTAGMYVVRKLHTTTGAQNRIQVLTPGTTDGYHRTYHPNTGYVHDVTTNPRSETSTGYLDKPQQVTEMLWVREELRAGQLDRFEPWRGSIPEDCIHVDLTAAYSYQRYENWMVQPGLVETLRKRISLSAAPLVHMREEPDGLLIQLHVVYVPG